MQHIMTTIFLHRDLLGAIPSRKHTLLALFCPFVVDGRSAEHGVLVHRCAFQIAFKPPELHSASTRYLLI